MLANLNENFRQYSRCLHKNPTIQSPANLGRKVPVKPVVCLFVCVCVYCVYLFKLLNV